MDPRLERDCIRAAVKADSVAESLLSLSFNVPEYRPAIDRVLDTIWYMENLLDSLPFELDTYHSAQHHVHRDLKLLLETVQTTLEVIRGFMNVSEGVGYTRTWLNMCEHLRIEIGSSMNMRFRMCIEFIELIREKLRRFTLLSLTSCFSTNILGQAPC